LLALAVAALRFIIDVWGRNPHLWGYQPNWDIEVLRNTLPSSQGITALTCDQKWNLCNEGINPAAGETEFNGPLNSALVVRGNVLRDGQGIAIHGTTSDLVVEGNFLHAGTGAFMKDPVQVDTTHTSPWCCGQTGPTPDETRGKQQNVLCV